MSEHEKYIDYQIDKEAYENEYGKQFICEKPRYKEGITRDCYKCGLKIMLCDNCKRDHHI